MHRSLILWLLLTMVMLGTAVVTGAQDMRPGDPGSEEPVVVPAPAQMIRGEWVPPPALAEPAPEMPAFPFTTGVTAAAAAADSCAGATALPSLPSGDFANVNGLTTGPTDPDLTCMLGAPASLQGFRTAWYRFTAPSNGVVTVDTFGSTYDTVVAVYTDAGSACSALTQIACNDDGRGLTARTRFVVSKGTTYYIEVADWKSGVPAAADLNLSVTIEPLVSRWVDEGAMAVGALSRHATVVNGDDIFIVGGQYVQNSIPVISNEIWRYETDRDRWTERETMPDVGLSNTTAVWLNGKIYVPGGYNGNNSLFDERHLVFDPASNTWVEEANIGDDEGTGDSADWPEGVPFAWAQAVADPNPSTGRYFLTGGLSSQPPVAVTASVNDEMFIFFENAIVGAHWFSAPPMNDARYGHVADWVDGKVCVAGGLTADGTNAILLPFAECYNPSTAMWSSIANMQLPRYGAGSAVAGDGRWYVFGGIDAAGAVAATEVYDPESDTWTVLDGSYDLGGAVNLLERGYPRGEFVGPKLWSFGGNTVPEEFALSQFNSLLATAEDRWLPIARRKFNPDKAPDDNITQARQLQIDQFEDHNFSDQDDWFDAFFFIVPSPRKIVIELKNLPGDVNYDLFLYDKDKVLQEFSTSVLLGKSEKIARVLAAGPYYLLVERVIPVNPPDPDDTYRIKVSD